MNLKQYFEHISSGVKKAYAVAEVARAKGLDPVSKVETPIAISLAEKAVGLISVVYPQLQDVKIVNRILELEKQYGQLTMSVCLGIAEDIAKEKFCKFESLIQAMDAGIRVAFSYFTLGVVSSPIEGYTDLKTNKTRDGKDYLVAYFSGPIRSAGTTAGCVTLMVIDYLRELFGFAHYDPTDDEIKRYVADNYYYHERITNLQYLPSEEEITFLAKNLPIQISGEPTDQKEVYNYKDLPRVETNLVRGGMCLIFSECLAQKASKGYRLLNSAKANGFKSTGFDFLGEYIDVIQKKKIKAGSDGIPTYMKDIVAGRPIYSHPSRSGGFRFRYGRARNAGFSATSVHPSTMAVSRSFLAIGTQLKIEKPTKGCAISMVENIEGPIVKLKDGSVVKPLTLEETSKLKNQIEEIIYLGDILFPLDDVINRNSILVKPGYVEEWWNLELKKAGGYVPNVFDVSFEEAINLSNSYSLPLYPAYTYYWSQIAYLQFLGLLDWIAHGKYGQTFVLPYSQSEKERFAVGKRALEIIGCPHTVYLENIIINSVDSKALLYNLGIVSFDSLEVSFDSLVKKVPAQGTVLEVINSLSGTLIKDKAGDFMGARMGRPEKSKLRKLTGSPHVIFPVGEEGGRLRSIQSAVEYGSVNSDFPNFFCGLCGSDSPYPRCPVCLTQCKRRNYCRTCEKYSDELCKEHPDRNQPYSLRRVDMKQQFDLAKKLIEARIDDLPVVIKGVRGTSSQDHSCEHLAKGLLRAKYNLHVNKDGTIRYDMTEMPLTHFKPKEIGTSVSKLIELGYEKDFNGTVLTNDDQILEIFPHDIVLPSCPDTLDEKADDVFFNITRFVDDELEKLYGLDKFFNPVNKESLLGSLFACIAPHICTATVGRLIGFSKTQVFFASPYMHAAMRRDCVYPSTKIMLYDNDTKKIFYDKIGNYVEKLILDGAKTKVIDDYGTISVENKINLYALGIDPNTHELKRKKIKYFVKGPETKEWIKITTATNREYVMTPTHKFMHIINGKFKFKDAKDAKIDDKLPVLEQLNFVLGKDCLDLIEIFRENLADDVIVVDNGVEKKLGDFSGSGKEGIFIRWKFSKHLIPSIIKLDKELMKFLGYYAAEGYSIINKWVAQVSFRICNKDMQDDLNRIIKIKFGIDSNKGEDGTKITVCCKVIYYLMKFLGCGQGAYGKRVPSFIFGLDKELVGEYLSAYHEGDGSVVSGKSIGFYSVSRSLLDDVALLLTKFGVIGRFSTTKERLPGRKVLERYKELGKEPKKHILHHLVLGKYDSYKILPYLKLVSSKREAFRRVLKQENKERYINYNGKQILMNSQSDYVEDVVKKVETVKSNAHSYCVEIEWKEKEDRNVLWGEQIINTRCDGDEAAVILLMDMLLNFSRKFLPSHRGGTQDAPLVLNIKINAGEVDDQILDFVCGEYPLELYELAEQRKHSSEVHIEKISHRLKEGRDPFTNLGFTHDCDNFNNAVLNSAYKTLPTMYDKVEEQMDLCSKIRAVDTSDVARLVIERHFIRDIRGNLRKFSQQVFRCVSCNDKYRRPPLAGKCTKCGGRIIFTISEGSIIKYMASALNLARTHKVSPYLLENLELVQSDIDSIFGKEKEKQMKLSFG